LAEVLRVLGAISGFRVALNQNRSNPIFHPESALNFPQLRRILLFAMIAVLLLWAPSAQAFVYWADRGNSSIGRANNDGTAVNDNFITGASEPYDVAVDSDHIYWANVAGNSIGRANIDGTGVEENFIHTIEPNGVALSGSFVFWSRSGNAIGRANLDGSSPNQEFVPAGDPCGVAVDSGHVYWTNDGDTNGLIGRSPLNTALPEQEFITIPHTQFPCGLAVNAGSIFWANFGLGFGTSIGRANVLTGTGVDESFVGEASAPCGVAVDESHLYWANSKTETIGRSGTDSTAVNQNFISTDGKEICGVAVNALAPSSENPPPPPPPSTPTISLGRLRPNTKKGTATLTATVNGGGSVKLSGSGLKSAAKQLLGAGTTTLPVKAKGKTKAALLKKGKAKVKVKVTFTASGGGSVSQVASGLLKLHPAGG